ncbi:hypothetical protein D9758_015366 [Tetrapyrgos nigripes]|uniref:Uncharacterized protein n=1 Tax=Tetrapyrgos nigripes TaxID=182062 RepID=A0A8H5FI66_9AGAR|nr:hypothetical protein D9758_015366 [Tetrapyrgos nigripes]
MSNRYSGSPKYMNDFSKALAIEVRILLDEMGKLRDERRQLQQEIAELLAVKAKHGNGWSTTPPPAIEAPPETSPPTAEPLAPAKGGWRVVHKRPERKHRDKGANTPAPAASPPLPAIAAPVPVAAGMPAWAQWRPNPTFTPPAVTPAAAPVSDPFLNRPLSRPGLFGPPSPGPK